MRCHINRRRSTGRSTTLLRVGLKHLEETSLWRRIALVVGLTSLEKLWNGRTDVAAEMLRPVAGGSLIRIRTQVVGFGSSAKVFRSGEVILRGEVGC